MEQCDESDEWLMAQVASGKRDRLSILLRRYASPLLTFIRRIERHCDQCRICQVALEEARKRLEAMQSLPAVEAPERLLRATERRIAQYRGPAAVVMKAGFGIAAAAALLIGAFHVYYLNLAPLPYDLKVLGQTEWLAGSQAALRIVLVDRQRGQGMAGVPVEVELAGERADQMITLASFTTNHLGSGDPRFRLPDWETGRYELRVRARPGGTQEAISRAVELKRSWRLMLVTDKPVYQPGQVIRARSLALRQPDLKPVAGQAATFSVTDPKGNVVYCQRDVTSRFGIAAADCPLADEIIEGPYQFECQVGDTVSRATVEVKRYVLPKFSIEVDLDRAYYQPAERMRGTLRAAYFFGKPVANADVEIELKTADAETRTFERLQVRTDAGGNASFEFLLPDALVGRQTDAGDATVALGATVRDRAGQQQSRSLSRVVTRQPIRIEVIPEGGSLVRDIPNVVYLFTSYPDGRPARARVAAGLDRELLTNDLGVASFTMDPPADRFRWIFLARDEAGEVGRREWSFDCGAAANDFLVRADKAVYDSGQTMRLLLRGHGNEPVFIDLVKDGQTVLTDAIAMAQGRGEYALDIPPELFGAIELCAYRFGADGRPIRRTRAIYVRPAHDLAIETRLERDEYRPGERARLTFALTDELGRPATGAISLAAVDEAVYSVLAGESSLERSFFTLEQELLKPVYTIYPWSPDMKAQLEPGEQERFEQAIFARTAQAGLALRSYLEGNPGVLAALERPGWRRMAAWMELPEELLALLGRRDAPHSLVATSFPDKWREVEAVKRPGLRAVKAAWTLLGGIGGLAALVFLSRNVTTLFGKPWRPAEWITVLVILAILVALLLPAVQSAREMSNRWPTRELEGLRFAFEQSRAEAGADAASVRVRQWFPETLLWRPELITDDAGLATIEVDLPDSITSWRLSASAVSGDGKLGGGQSSIRVFQPFFVDLDLPLALTRGDEVELPVVVYNYLDKPQSVELNLADCAGLARLDEAVKVVELAAGEVRSVGYRLRAEKIGRFDLEVTARGEGVADAVRRQIEIEPDGRRVEQVVNGNLDQPAEVDLAVPDDAIEGSVKAIIRIYPSTFSQLVEGLDAIFQKPYGCFEQTSSTTYPNVLALDYLRRTGKPAPEIEAKARAYIHLGYQRLLSFEVDGGGFDWFGSPPANATLTAYGLMEFDDMARVHDVDPALIERTRHWLLDQQQADGSWDSEVHRLHHDPTRAAADLARLSTTAYIGWAVFGGRSEDDPKAQATLDYLLRHEPAAMDDAYVLALVANSLAAIDSSGRAAGPYLERLAQMRHTSADGKLAWWDTSRTLFYGAGRGGSIETTALAALAMLHAGYEPPITRGALAWLAGQKDALGTWHSTQATVLALKALLAGTGKPLGGERERTIEIAADGLLIHQAVIPADDSDVVQQFDLSSQLGAGRGRLLLTERGGGGTGYQVVLSYHLPGASQPPAQPPMSVELAYDRTELSTGDTLAVKATLTNHMSAAAPMVLVDLPIPAGFAIEPDDLAQLAATRRIAKYQLTPRSAIIYLRQLPPAQAITLTYRLRATMPVKVTAAPARAYEYYDPDTKAASETTELIVNGD
ncbi:MAG: alpha-2-macroglobulin family protein [Pirellulales bacterium]